MDQTSLFSAQVTTLARLVDELSQLFFRVGRRVFRRRLNPDELNSADAGPIRRTYRQTENAIEELHWQRHRERNSFRQRQPHQLWRLLAHHNVQRGDDRESDGESDAVPD